MAKSSAASRAKASADDSTGGQGDVDEVSFKPAKGGLISSTRSRQKGVSRGFDDYKTTTTIHPSMSHAVKHFKESLKHVFGSDSGSED